MIGDTPLWLDFLGATDGGQGTLDCDLAENVDDDARTDISDAVYMLSWLFSNTAPIPAPHPLCGTQPPPGSLGCMNPPT